MTEGSARSAIVKLFFRSRKIRFKDQFMVERFLRNNLEPANYYFNSGFIFVTNKDEPPTILTVEFQNERKLGVDFFYDESE